MISPYEGDTPYIFISYSHQDTAAALQIISKLQELGYAVWYDKGISPGSIWSDNIAQHIECCEYFIALISQSYLDSTYCIMEVNYAVSESRPHLPVYLEDVELTSGLKMQLSIQQAIYRSRYDSEMDFLRELMRANEISVCRITHEEAESTESLRSKCANYDRKGNAAKKRGKLYEAGKWYMKAFTIREQMVKDTGTAVDRRNLSVSYEKLGNIAQALREMDDASEQYQKALCLREVLVDEVGTAQAQRDLSVGYRNLGEIAMLRRNIEDAEGWYRRALSISEKLIEESRTAQACRDLSLDYTGLGDVAQFQGIFRRRRSGIRKGENFERSLLKKIRPLELCEI